MAKTTIIQRDFSGGEISRRLMLRNDIEAHGKSVGEMENWMPTLQGSAERTPGTQHLREIGSGAPITRIIPYLSPANERSIVQITEGAIEFIPNATENLDGVFLIDEPISTTPTTQIIRANILPNGDIQRGVDPWILDPEDYLSNYGGNPLMGGLYQGGRLLGTVGDYDGASDFNPTCIFTNEAVVLEDTNIIDLDLHLTLHDAWTVDVEYTCTVKVGTTLGGGEVFDLDFEDFSEGTVGSTMKQIHISPTLGLLKDDILYVKVEFTIEPGANSALRFELKWLRLIGNKEIELGDGTITGGTPYLDAELPDLHFIQSPLMPYEPSKATKELVITHPNHPPYRLHFDDGAAAYVFEPIPFENIPATWSAGNYPATCGSYHGRLVLAGSQGKPLIGTSIAGDTETVWCTEVGRWDAFSNNTEVNPDDSVEFTTIYRSPIQWVYGQKDLLVGTLESEYIASAEGIFQPADLGVYMHSTHGSAPVQPAGFGETVLFAAEGGTKVRGMSKSSDDEGWIAPDITLLNPSICEEGIVRMVRMRNPHQMLVALLRTGELAILHYDKNAGILGWSRITNNSNIKDICVMANDEGEDILFTTVKRWVRGVGNSLFLEAYTNWTEAKDWVYLNSHSTYSFGVEGGQSYVDDLERHEGNWIQVLAEGNYVGAYKVTGGRVDFTDLLGNPVSYGQVTIGKKMTSTLKTLPIVGEDPKSKKRYSEISVHLLASIIPRIGVANEGDNTFEAITERQPTRAVHTNLGEHQQRPGQQLVTVGNTGWSTGQVVWIVEHIPQRVEVIAIHGKLQENSL